MKQIMVVRSKRRPRNHSFWANIIHTSDRKNMIPNMLEIKRKVGLDPFPLFAKNQFSESVFGLSFDHSSDSLELTWRP